jgi:outer membrane protein assembly factor BamB
MRKIWKSTATTFGCALAALLLAHRAASGQQIEWENRGQAEPGGMATDIASGRDLVVASGAVFDELGSMRWFVRAVDVATGATQWEDRFGPGIDDFGKDVAVEGHRAFVAGWTYTPIPGVDYSFTCRAYDLESGALLWSHEIQRGKFFDTAKVVDVHAGRVFVAGYLTATNGRPDFAVLAFDAATGQVLWESLDDPSGAGQGNAAWAVRAKGDGVFALGEIGNARNLFLRAYDARTGAIRWEQTVPGARNFSFEDTLAVVDDGVFIAGMDATGHFFVRAYEATSGALRWADHVDDGARLGDAGGLAIGGGQVLATGVVDCSPIDFTGCKLAVRAYDAQRGLLWQRADDSRGGDWGSYKVAAGEGQVYVGPLELMEDGQPHPRLRAYAAADGALLWEEAFDGEGLGGFVSSLLVLRGRLFAGGFLFTSVDGAGDFVVRQYESR